MSDERWTDPAQPPVDGCVDLGGSVWACWAEGWAERNPDGVTRPLIWHWCDRTVELAHRRPEQQDWWFTPRWIGAGVRAHDFIAADPLHLEPSLYWPDCCGKHGFIRDGRWISV